MAADVLRLLCVSGIGKDDLKAVVFVIGHSQRRGVKPVDVQKQCVKGGYGARRTVGIDKRDALQQGDQHRNEGVEAAHLDRAAVFELAPHFGGHINESLKGIDGIGGKVLSEQRFRRTHARGYCRVCIIVHFLRVEKSELNGLARIHFLVLVEKIHAARCGAAASSAQNGCTVDNVYEILLLENS